jgi:chemosensory pili system protein ChpB (putative protein-glutamate methylesterase)
MSNSARRVVLLARPGAARDRMREALGEAGANVVLEVDPTATDQAALLEARPEVALVVLDAATDEALERFDGLLANPQVEVFFEEAEHAVGRVGWDAARWVRHLSAKLHHSDNVLPPGRSAESVAVAMPTASVATIALPPPLPEAPEIAPVGVHSDMELLSFELGDEAPHYANEHSADPATPLAAKLELQLVDDMPGDSAPDEIKVEGLELEEDHPSDAHRFQNDLNDLHSRIASMELVVDESPARVRGAVLVLAGIGGPDAVRQLLGALPGAFPRAVLVQQRLDGGHYDKLVAQMQRATALPVRLAVAGDALQSATVYILPPTLGVQESGQGLVFTDSPVDLLLALPAGDSAVLMLSGSDPGQVDAVMKLGAGGALIAGQALDGCYDVAAPAALVSRGGQAGKPQELARRLAERWH